jgi:predicted nucleic acid-binding protein
MMHEPGSLHVVSWLTVLETQSAFAFKVRTGEIDDADFATLRKRLKADIFTRSFIVSRVLRRHFDRAELLLAKHGLRRRLRSLDALHLAIAADLYERSHIDALVTTDSTMHDLGKIEGLAVVNPLATS